jgi:hypothetical protein
MHALRHLPGWTALAALMPSSTMSFKLLSKGNRNEKQYPKNSQNINGLDTVPVGITAQGGGGSIKDRTLSRGELL